ncbi:hypothetical protein ABW19_dt0205666 [Dactylella cylindrospora]|nr:hypothetical protein ABW19_dt0205666 [Dactylella cylindrospora]
MPINPVPQQMQPQMMSMPIQMHFAPVPHPTDMANFGNVGPENGGSTFAAFQATGAHSRSVSHASPELQMSPTMDHYGAFTGEYQTIDARPESISGAKRSAEDHDQSLRELAKSVKDKSLTELAERVRVSDNTAGAERERQGFGMGWLQTHCRRTKEESAAIPRNRVYTHYVTACGDARIKCLNPASFGKLVRIVFPEIKTRRLGVRGHSKYHYCGITLVTNDDQDEDDSKSHISTDLKVPILPSNNIGQDTVPQEPAPGEWTSLLQDSDPIGPPPQGTIEVVEKLPAAPVNQPIKLDSAVVSPDELIQELVCFLSPAEELRPDMTLPKIFDYVPPDTDSDNVRMLEATYRTHALQLIESFKTMNMKIFHKLWVQFQGHFTAPILKLLSDPRIADWIEDADWELYKELLTMVQNCVKTVIPPKVFDQFRRLSTNLESHIRDSLTPLPDHVIEARVRPAAVFCKLLEQALRTNMTCHAAARILGNEADVQTMETDWQTMVKAEKIVQRELPCKHPLATQILRDEIVNLVSGREPAALPGPLDLPDENGIFDHWVRWLDRLPLRFPGVPARTLLMSVSSVASAAIRDITLNGGEGFGGWWVLVTFVEEYLRWNAERGGFFQRQPFGPRKPAPTADTISIQNDNPTLDGSIHQYVSAHTHDSNDDSGISLRDDSYDNIILQAEKVTGAQDQTSTAQATLA